MDVLENRFLLTLFNFFSAKDRLLFPQEKGKTELHFTFLSVKIFVCFARIIMNIETLLFFIVGGIAIASAVFVVTRKHALYSALFLIVNMCSLAVLYLMLQAQFIAIIQILVYAGAIMVLFIFVIMLLNLEEEKPVAQKLFSFKTFGFALCVVLLAQFIFAFSKVSADTKSLSPNAAQMGTVEYIGKALFNEYLFPFEAISFLLLAAIVGAVVLAKKKFQ